MLARNPSRRPGQLSLITVFAVLTLLLLIAGVLNVTRVTATKMEQQNAADAAAHAAGIELARGMNAVTALNHLIVELNALDALAMSFGGLELEEFQKDGVKRVDLPNEPALLALPNAQVWDGGIAPRATAAARTRKSKSGGAIGDGRKKLLPMLARAYLVHAAGGVMCTDPKLRQTFEAAGRYLVATAALMEANIEFEWMILDQLEVLAETKLLPLKWLCNHGLPEEPEEKWGIIPRLYKQSVRTVEETPARAELAALKVAEQHGAVGTLFPNTTSEKFKLQLPVEKEVIHRGSEDHLKSQMVRGMTPWVQYWRRPILDYGVKVLPLAEFAPAFHKHSNEFTLNMAWWQWVENRTHLYRLKDLDVTGEDKGREEWTTEEGSDRANERFGVLGFALKPPPDVIGMPIFRQPQPDGMAAHAQVMIYNANPQEFPRKRKMQPLVGWDTLAWEARPEGIAPRKWPLYAPEFVFGKDYDEEMARPRAEQPRVKLNWNAKLVPVTTERLTNAIGTQGPELNRILERLVTDRALVNTH